MKAAIIENGIVKNIVLVSDGEFANSRGWVISASAKVGDSYDEVTGIFTAPTPLNPVPKVVSRFQARAALHKAGLLSQVQTMMDDPATDPITVLAWQDAQEFQRDSPTVASMAEGLGLTEAEVDELFFTAVTIKA